MWWLLAFVSAALLGCYDSAKKISLKDNAVIPVLFLNTVLSALIFSPFLFATGFGGWAVQKYILLKSALVLSSWLAGYFAMKHLPLTISRLWVRSMPPVRCWSSSARFSCSGNG